eukprot:5159253-Pleurochrysis_carterae.AAC.1
MIYKIFRRHPCAYEKTILRQPHVRTCLRTARLHAASSYAAHLYNVQAAHVRAVDVHAAHVPAAHVHAVPLCFTRLSAVRHDASPSAYKCTLLSCICAAATPAWRADDLDPRDGIRHESSSAR